MPDMKDDGVTPIALVDADNATPPEVSPPEQQAAADFDGGLDLFPKRTWLHRASYPPRLSINGLLIGLLCLLLLVVIGFVPVSLPSPLNIGRTVSSYSQLTPMQYTFQIPLALFMAAFLGPFMGTGVILLFLVLGLFFFPVFANGGGWHYLSEPGFGYLLGTFFAASILSKTFHKAFQKRDKMSRSLKLLATALAGVALLHGIGLIYLVALSVTGQLSWAELPGRALRLSIETAPYDFVVTFVFLCLVRQFRLALWLVLY
ncbi:biotin transporter BioY [Vampirovibrio sp.]|uniref:biotin transporter BioY n=1 Tax=Vampirovibrio sp. TaxID=2717857 RepID=UPI003594850C